MFTYIQQLGVQSFIRKEAPYLGLSLVGAELFYKFHSFILESIAFLVTWYLLSWMGSNIFNRN